MFNYIVHDDAEISGCGLNMSFSIAPQASTPNTRNFNVFLILKLYMFPHKLEMIFTFQKNLTFK
jgi:hypothetical protein